MAEASDQTRVSSGGATGRSGAGASSGGATKGGGGGGKGGGGRDVSVQASIARESAVGKSSLVLRFVQGT